MITIIFNGTANRDWILDNELKDEVLETISEDIKEAVKDSFFLFNSFQYVENENLPPERVFFQATIDLIIDNNDNEPQAEAEQATDI